MGLPDRRTLTVWSSLVGAMTLASGLLLLLEPNPTAISSNMMLSSVRPTSVDPRESLFQSLPPADSAVAVDRTPAVTPWSAIVVRTSGTAAGSAEDLDRRHRQMGLDGLGHHFVINNGTGAEDGQIEIGFRWQDQKPGAHSIGANSEWLNRHAIGICLIGDDARQPPTEQQLHQLVWLVQRLQARLGIPADRVMHESESLQDGPAGRMFPTAWFRKQLLTLSTP